MIGAQTTSEQVNAEACKLAQAWAATAHDVLDLAAYVDGLDIAGLQGIGFTDTAEATAFKAAVDYLKTVALIWSGSAGQADPYDFADELSDFVGPDPAGRYRT